MKLQKQIENLMHINERIAALERDRVELRDVIAYRLKHKFTNDNLTVTPYKVPQTKVKAYIRNGYSTFRITTR